MREKSVICRTSSDKETIDLGLKLGALLEGGEVIALAGDLGSGKTWFTKGVALGLDVSPDAVVTSPSFALMNDYEGRCTLYHMDVYRLENVSDFFDAGLDDYLYEDGVTVMEWADRWPEILPEKHLKVLFMVLDADSREITLSGHHPKVLKILKHMDS